MTGSFFEQPILNSPYQYPARHWELDRSGQPTTKIIDARRRAEFITPIPKPKKRKKFSDQKEMVFDEGAGLSTEAQQYDPTPIINEIRRLVDGWRSWPNSSDWKVTPETAPFVATLAAPRLPGNPPFLLPLQEFRKRHQLDGVVAGR